MLVKNTGARLYILGDHNNSQRRKGTQLLPGKVVEVTGQVSIACIERGIRQGKPFQKIEADKPAPKPKKQEPKKVEADKPKTFGGLK